MAAVWREGDDLLLQLYIQSKASRDSIVGPHGEELKVAITAPPIDGKANAHLSKYLAKLCKVAKGSVVIEKANWDATNKCVSYSQAGSQLTLQH